VLGSLAEEEEFSDRFLIKKLDKITPVGLLITLILIFIFQGDKIIAFPYHLVLIATALLIHTYLILSLAYFGAKKLRIPYAEAAPTAFIGASSFLELAVAVSTILIGVDSGVTLAITIGVLVGVPVMLSLVAIMKRNKSKFNFNIAK